MQSRDNLQQARAGKDRSMVRLIRRRKKPCRGHVVKRMQLVKARESRLLALSVKVAER